MYYFVYSDSTHDFSRYVVLVPFPDKTTDAVAHTLVTNVMYPFTTPKVILSVSGGEFENQILEALYRLYDIKQTFMTAHHQSLKRLSRKNKS